MSTSDAQEHTFSPSHPANGGAASSSERAGQLQALRALHKLDKQKRSGDSNQSVMGSVGQPGLSDSQEQTGQFNPQFGEAGTGGAVGGFRGGSPKNSPPKHSKLLPSQEKRDISITLSAYNVQLKKAADKEFFKLREEFSHSLVKLESLDTRDVGLKEAQDVITRYRGDPKIVRLVISLLQSRTTISSILSKESEMLLLGHLARTFGTKLIDTLDNPPSFTKTIFRLLELMESYFKFSNEGVKRACAKSWSDVYNNCFKNAPNNKKHYFLIQPLVAMIRGGSLVVVQETACQVLLDLLRIAGVERDSNFIDLVIDDCFDLFLTLRSCQITLLKLVTYLTVHSNFDLVSIYLPKSYEKVVVLLDSPDQSDHLTKIEICKFLEVIGHKLLKHATNYIGLNSEFLIKRIQDLTKDRVSKVQMSARETLRIWKKVEKVYQEAEKNKTRVKFDVRDPEKLIEMNLSDARGQANLTRGMSPPGGSPNRNLDQEHGRKNVKGIRDDSLEVRKPNGPDAGDKDSYSSKSNSIARGAAVFKSNNLVEKTHLKQRAHNFQKKRTGTGGGFITHYDPSRSRSHSKKKTCFNDVREQFKEQIMNDKLNFTNQRNDSRSMIRSKYQNFAYKRPEDEGDEELDEMDNQDAHPLAGNEYMESKVVSNWSGVPPVTHQEQRDEEEKPAFERKPAKIVQQQQQPPPQQETVEFEQEAVAPGDESAPAAALRRREEIRRDSMATMSSDRRSSGERLEGIDYLPRKAPNEDQTVYASSVGDDDQRYEEYTLPAQSEVGYGRDPSVASTTYLNPGQGLNRDQNSLADTVYIQRKDEQLPQYGDDQTVYYDSSQEEEPDSPVATDTRSRYVPPQQREVENNPPSGLLFDEFVVAWAQALDYLNQGRIDEAYKLLLDKDDDIYLLRLMNKTGVCYDHLTPATARRLQEKANRISQSSALQNMARNFAQPDPPVREAPYSAHQENPYGREAPGSQMMGHSATQPQMSRTMKLDAPSRLESHPTQYSAPTDPRTRTSNKFERTAPQNNDGSPQLMRIEEYPMQQPAQKAQMFERSPTQSFSQPVPPHSEILARYGYVGNDYIATLNQSRSQHGSELDYLSGSQPEAGWKATARQSLKDSLALTASLASQEEQAARQQLEHLQREARILYQQLGRELN